MDGLERSLWRGLRAYPVSWGWTASLAVPTTELVEAQADSQQVERGSRYRVVAAFGQRVTSGQAFCSEPEPSSRSVLLYGVIPVGGTRRLKATRRSRAIKRRYGRLIKLNQAEGKALQIFSSGRLRQQGTE